MATFGDSTNYTSTSRSSSSAKVANVASPASSGTVTSLTALLDKFSGTVTAAGVIYADSGGSPGALLAVTGTQTITGSTLASWTFNFTGANQISITAGTNYWIGVWWGISSGSIDWGRGSTASAAVKSNDTTSGPASTFGTTSNLSGPLGVFVTYTVGGGGTAYRQSLTAGASFTGGFGPTTTNKVLSAAASFAGSSAKRISRLLTASIDFGSIGVSPAGVPIPTSDAFGYGSVPDAGLWSTTGATDPSQVTVASGQLQITHTATSQYNSAQSTTSYGLIGTSTYVQVVDAGNMSLVSHQAVFGALTDSNNSVFMTALNGQLQAYKKVAGTQTQIGAGITYSATTHAWWRIREAGGTTFFDTAPDSGGTPGSWTNRWSVTNPITLTALTIYLQSGCYANEASGSHSYFDNWFAPAWTQDYQTFQTDSARHASIINFYQHWGSADGTQNFVRSYMDAISANGTIPMITWEPWVSGGGATQPTYSLTNIINGNFDTYITNFAAAAQAWSSPFYLRFAHEMNGNWYPWAEGVNGNTSGQYAQAWQHVWKVCRAAGLTNATWVWAPNVEFSGSTALSGLYPGDGYVGWLGIDGYNWGTDAGHSWQTFTQVFTASNTYSDLCAVSEKPIMITEVACSPNGGDKAAWITNALGAGGEIYNFPRFQKFIWFNNNNTPDWRIESSPGAQDAFKQAMATYRSATTKRTIIPQTAVVSFTGSIPARATKYVLSAAVSFAGTTGRSVRHGLTAALSFAGSQAKVITRSLGGALSFTGALSAGHRFVKALASALSFNVGGPSGPTARVQFNHNYPGSVVSFFSNVTAGNLILVAASGSGSPGTIATPTDSLGNTYSLVNNVNALNGTLYVYYAITASSGLCTVSITGTAGDKGLTIVEYSGLGATPVISSATFHNGATANDYVSLSAGVGDVLFAAWADESTNPASLTAADSNFTIFQRDTSHYDAQEDYVNVATAGNYNTGFVLSAGSANSIVVGVDIKPSGGSTASLTKQTLKGLPAGLSFVGSIARGIRHVLAAAISFVGNLAGVKVGGGGTNYTQTLTAALSFTGAQAKQTVAVLSAAVSFTGAIAKRISRAVTAGLSFAGSIVKFSSRVVTAGLSFTGNVSRLVKRSVTGALSFTGAQVKAVAHNLIAGLSFTGSAAKRITAILTATTSFIGNLASVLNGGVNHYTQSLTASVSFTGNQAKRVARSVTGAVSFTGSTSKTLRRVLSASMSFLGALSVGGLHQLALAASVAFTGAMGKRTGKQLAGAASFTGTTRRTIAHGLTAALSFSGGMGKLIGRAISAVVGFLGGLISANVGVLPSNEPEITVVDLTTNITQVELGSTLLAVDMNTNVMPITLESTSISTALADDNLSVMLESPIVNVNIED